MIKLRLLVPESFVDDYAKNQWINLPTSAVKKYAEELSALIVQAYATKGGNFEIQSANDLINSDLNYWLASDIDQDPDADVVLGGKQTKHGTKMTIMGQDGSSMAKKSAISRMIDLMKKRGFYAEMDVELAQKLSMQPIKDKQLISQVLAGKELDYNTDGSYQRLIGPTKTLKTKVMVGIPKVI